MDESFEELIAIVELLKDAEFTQFRYQSGDLLIEISRGEPLPTQTSPAPTTPLVGAGELNSSPDAATPGGATPASTSTSAPAPAPAVDAGTVVVEAPMLGTFYRSPKPGEPPFVKVGDTVTESSVVGIVEVMKLMNSVTAGVAGTVVAIDAVDGELVEPGSTLVRIQPAE